MNRKGRVILLLMLTAALGGCTFTGPLTGRRYDTRVYYVPESVLDPVHGSSTIVPVVRLIAE